MTDAELLKEYLDSGCETAFATLVHRHLPLVHGIAVRRLRDAHAAEDVTQKVFCTLARNAATIRKPAHLAAWLHQTTRQHSLLHMRTELRRRQREQAAAPEPASGHGTETDLWAEVEPHLDDALNTLREPDRVAVILRFLQRRPIAEVAANLGVTEPAAKMRIGRALERLRAIFARQGVACTAAALLLALDRDTQAAPPPSLEPTVAAAVRSLLRQPPVGGLASTPRVGWLESLARWPVAAGLAALVVTGLLATGLGPAAIKPTPGPSTAAAGPGQASTTGAPAVEATVTRAGSLPMAAVPLRLTVLESGTDRPLPGIRVTASDLGVSVGRFQTDGRGEVVVPRPAAPRGDFYFRLRAESEGYVSTLVSWSRYQQDDPDDVPSELVLRLAPAIRVGGVVVNEQGEPVPNAPVLIQGGSIFTGPPPHERPLLLDGGQETTVTDANGRWTSDRIPAHWDRLHFQVDLPGYLKADCVADGQDGAGSDGQPRISRQELLEEGAEIRLAVGVSISGRVLDGAGVPIAGAEVVRDRRWRESGARTRSATDGSFAIRNARPGRLTLTVQAENYAPLEVRREVEGPIGGVDVVLAPGSLLRGSVVDGTGQPVAGATVEVAGGETGVPAFEWRTVTDSDGRFAWTGAPADPIRLELSKAGYRITNAVVAAGGPPRVVIMDRWETYATVPLEIRALDDSTGAVLERFEVRRAENHGGFGPVRPGTNGMLSLAIAEHTTSAMIEIRAAGHAPSQVEWGPQDRPRQITVRLKAARGWSGTVLLPDGKPAAGAEIAISTPQRSPLLGDRRFAFPEETPLARADENGQFRLEPIPREMSPGRVLVAVHAAGFVELDAEAEGEGLILELEAWGRIEGVLRSSGGPLAGRKIGLFRRSWNPWTPGLDLYEPPFATVTDAGGRFVFPHVPAGAVALGLRDGDGPVERRATVVVGPGGVARVGFGGEGRTVTGTVTLPVELSALSVGLGTATLRRTGETPADLPVSRRDQFSSDAAFAAAKEGDGQRRLDHWKSAAGLAAWLHERSYRVRVGDDGRFVAEDVPAGEYELLYLPRKLQAFGGPNPPISVPAGRPVYGRVRVPENPESVAGDSPVDVGTIALQR